MSCQHARLATFPREEATDYEIYDLGNLGLQNGATIRDCKLACGSAKCSRHNFVVLDGVEAALTADTAFAGGWYKAKPDTG